MLEDLNGKADALSKIADLVGKKTVVMWAMLTTFTTGYLYYDSKVEERRLNDVRIEELKQSQKDLINTVQGMKHKQDIYIPKLDTTLKNANKTLQKLNNENK